MCLGNICEAHEQQLSFITSSDGLPNSMIHQIKQDNDGFIWIATFYGLYRYDGFSFLPYKSTHIRPHLLPNNNVISITPDHDNGLLIGTHIGYCHLDKATGKVKQYIIPDFDSQRVNNILVCRNKQVYVGTIRGIALLDKKADRLNVLSKVNSTGDVPTNVNIQDMCEDTQGNIVIATWGHGIYHYDTVRKHFTHYSNLNGEICFRSILCDSRERIWAASYNGGVFRLLTLPSSGNPSIQQIKPSQKTGSKEDDYVLSLCEDKEDGSIWMGTSRGVVIIKNNGISSELYDGSLLFSNIPHTEVLDIAQDYMGTMWLSTQGKGILKVQRVDNLFQTYSDLKTQRILGIAIGRDGGLWTAINNRVEYRQNGITKTLLSNIVPLNISLGQHSGHIFISTMEDGIYELYNGEVVRHETSKKGDLLYGNHVFMAKEDRNGNLWAATYKGLCVRLANGRIVTQQLQAISDVLKGQINAIDFASDGTAWIATLNDGVVRLTGSPDAPATLKAQVFSSKNNGMSVDNTTCIFTAANGQIWAGTEGGGLCLFDKKESRFVSVHDFYHLPGDMVNSIISDAQGQLWIGTNQGLVRISTNGKQKDKVRIYTMSHGLPGNFIEQNAVAQKDGDIFFGTSNGLFSFNPANENTPEYEPAIAITGLLIDGQQLENLDSITRQDISPLMPTYVRKMNIPASVKGFSVIFASLNYDSKIHTLYAYRLQGLDSEWQYTTERKVSYNYLDDGNYTFEIKARDNDGMWSKTQSIAITVEPPFWETRWAYTIYLLIFGIAVWKTTRHVRQKMMTKNKIKLSVGSEKPQIIIDHNSKPQKGDSLQKKDQLHFEIKDLNYSDADEQLLLKAIECVNMNLSNMDFGPMDLAVYLTVSRATLFNKLKALTGMNASGFIRSIRLKTAYKQLNEHPESRINELAYKVGFNDPKYFSSCFKKEFGMTPSEFVNSRNIDI